MDGSILQPAAVGALFIAMVVTLYDMGASLRPARCSECAHCRAAALEEARTQERLTREYARRTGLDDEDDDRQIG